MGPILHETPGYGSIFKKKSLKIGKFICLSLNSGMGTSFWKISTPENGLGFWGPLLTSPHRPHQIQVHVPPQDIFVNTLISYHYHHTNLGLVNMTTIYLSIYLGYVNPLLNVALLMFTPYFSIFCYSRPSHTDVWCYIISPSSLLSTSPSFSHSLNHLYMGCKNHIIID